MVTWKELREFGENCARPCFKTTLLGAVPYVETKSGELTGVINPSLQREANREGILIEAALFREGAYLLRLIPMDESPGV